MTLLKNRIILGIDSTAGVCSVALWRGGKVASYLEEKTVSNQAKLLIPMIEQMLGSSSVDYSDLSAIAVTVGAGSFTGIRIGLATARGIGFAAKIPVLGYASLEVLAFSLSKNAQNQPIIAKMNAGKGEVVYQEFNQDILPIGEINLRKLEAGEIFECPRADYLAEYAASYPERAVKPVPFYIRPPDAKLPETSPIRASAS